MTAVSSLLQRAARLQELGRWPEAAQLYAALAEGNPADHRLRANQGNALWLADLPQAAAAAYRQALAIVPDCAVSLRGLASCLRDLGQWDDAIATHRRAADRLIAGSAEAAMNRWAESQVLLGQQRWAEAFTAMTGRPREGTFRALDPLQPALTLRSEQGYGDTFQYLRCLPELVERRWRAGLRGGLVLQVESNLVDLLRQGLAWLPDPPLVHDREAPRSPAAAVLSLLDLPQRLGIEQVRPMSPYLHHPLWPEAQRRGPPRRVGVCWAAGRKLDDPFTAREYHKRTLPPAVLWRLLEGLQHRGVEIVSLQVGPDAGLASALGLPLTPPPEPIDTFLGTARVLRQLDRLVCVDTAIAHLAGALGVPTLILLPWSADPRWLAEGSCTPWYASLTLIRQPQGGDWHGALDALFTTWDTE